MDIIGEIERDIEDALWDNRPPDEALTIWQTAEKRLLDIPTDSPEDLIKERDRVLSYCLLRQCVHEPRTNLGTMLRSLEYALRSGDKVQTMRAYGSLSGAYRGCGDYENAKACLEKQMAVMDTFTDGERDSYDAQQGYGWYGIFWARIHFDECAYERCLADLDQAEGFLGPIGNYAGMRRIHSMRSDCLRLLGKDDEASAADAESIRYGELSKRYRR